VAEAEESERLVVAAEGASVAGSSRAGSYLAVDGDDDDDDDPDSAVATKKVPGHFPRLIRGPVVAAAVVPVVVAGVGGERTRTAFVLHQPRFPRLLAEQETFLPEAPGDSTAAAEPETVDSSDLETCSADTVAVAGEEQPRLIDSCYFYQHPRRSRPNRSRSRSFRSFSESPPPLIPTAA
jgi:hypothetical protein